jgi:CRP-like cAMP-binding protein
MSEPTSAPPAEKIKEVAVNPEASLEPRAKDVAIPVDRLMQVRDCIGLFMNLKSKPSVEKWPGTLVLRRYHPGEVICQQGESGMSAFYVLTDQDEDRLRSAGVLGPKHTMVDIALGQEALSVHLAIPRASRRAQKWWEKIAARLSGKKSKGGTQTRFIPIDAPTGVDYETKRASLSAGDLFGEMSCLYRTPRSATVVAEQDCYVIEILRNVLDQLKRDPKFKEEMDRKYKERVFALQVLNLPLFQNLPDELIAWLRDHATLKSYKAGEIICDEHDASEDMFIIRSGLVKVSQGSSALYSQGDVLNWSALANALNHAPPGNVVSAIRDGLPDDIREQLVGNATALAAETKQFLLQTLNDRIKGGSIADEFRALPQRVSFAEFSLDMPESKDRTSAENRRLNRVYLDGQLGGAVRTWRLAAGPETILRYASRGDLIGEMGVMLGRPRSATCVAYVHSRTGQAREDVRSTDEEVVELVHIPAEVFLDLLERPGAEKLRRQVENLIAERQQADIQRREVGTALSAARRISPDFERLGLIQGQKLMLVDLDRCTRCDECVRACADVHDDGRSRLFLEGPRFEHYLVPLTCRSCLDPVCMIGCPVGSINRGDNKQMVIEDWCIGCGMCAKQCPYGSIQMHDEGVIPGSSRGWFFIGDAKQSMQAGAALRLANWQPVKTPVRRDRDFRRLSADASVVWFGRDFDVAKELLAGDHVFELKLTAPNEQAEVFINGRKFETKEKIKRDFTRLYPMDSPNDALRPGRNQVLVRVVISADHAGDLFDLRLDSIEEAKRSTTQAVEYVNKSVAFRAVVCDLCSSLPGQVPSCVNACPHEAAMRVDARSNFPVG